MIKNNFLAFVAITSLIAFSKESIAEWYQFSIDKSGERIYVNKKERAMSGNIVSITFLTEFDESRTSKASNGERYVRLEYISQKEDVQLDCSQKKFRIMQTNYFQLPMAQGKGYKSPSIPSDWFEVTTKPIFGKEETKRYWQQKMKAGCDDFQEN